MLTVDRSSTTSASLKVAVDDGSREASFSTLLKKVNRKGVTPTVSYTKKNRINIESSSSVATEKVDRKKAEEHANNRYLNYLCFQTNIIRKE